MNRTATPRCLLTALAFSLLGLASVPASLAQGGVPQNAATVIKPAAVSARSGVGIVHNTGTVQFEVFANGNLGTIPPNWTGTGFVFDGDAGLFTGSFVVGASPTQVSGNYYGSGTNTLEWVQVSPLTEITPPFEQPYEAFTQGLEAVYNDSNAPNPIGLQVTQRSYSRNDDPYTGFVIVEFIIENTSGEDLTGLYPGVFADWDVGPGNAFQQNLGGYDEATNLLYIYDDTGAWSSYFGVAALGDVDVSGVFYDALGGPEIDSDIYTFLTTILPEPSLGDDRRATLGVGPIDIAAGESATVRFAFVGGEGEAGVIANAAAAQAAVAEPVEEAIHDTGVVQFEAFNTGFLGSYAADAAGNPAGAGFVFDGDNGLYEGQFLVGISPGQVSGDPYSLSNEGFVEWSPVSDLFPAVPPEGFDQAYVASFDDSSAPVPIGVTVTQVTYSAEGDSYVVADFTVENTSGGDLSAVYLGVFADWDVGNYAQNRGGYVEEQQLLYVYDGSGGSTNYFGVAALDRYGDVDVSGVFHDALPGDDVLYLALSNISPDAEIGDDRRSVLGVGPYDIAAGESVRVQFAFVGGDSLEDLIANAAEAQGNPVAAQETTEAGTFVLHAAYPNPFSSSTTLSFTLPVAQHVRLSVYDVLGRRVATLVDEVRMAGDHPVVFDASALPSGTYLYRLEAGSSSLTQRLTLLR